MNWHLEHSCQIALMRMPQKPFDDKSTLVQLMARYRQATSHYLIQCWPKFMSPYGLTRPQWIELLGVIIDSKLSWKNHIDYACNKLTKCLVSYVKAGKTAQTIPHQKTTQTIPHQFILLLRLPILNILYAWDDNYPSNLEKWKGIKKLVPRTGHTLDLCF